MRDTNSTGATMLQKLRNWIAALWRLATAEWCLNLLAVTAVGYVTLGFVWDDLLLHVMGFVAWVATLHALAARRRRPHITINAPEAISAHHAAQVTDILVKEIRKQYLLKDEPFVMPGRSEP